MPSVLSATSGWTRMSGMSWPRYWMSGRPLEISIFLTSISSRRVTRDSGTAFGCAAPAWKISSETISSLDARTCAASSVTALWAVMVPTDLAMPFGSMIMITEPSPKIVLPENMLMWRSRVDIGLTTISSVWKTPSTTMPKVSRPTCVTTMKPFSGPVFSPLSILSRLLR